MSAPSGAAVSPRARLRLPLAIAAVVVVGVAAFLLLGGGRATQTGYLDPDNPGPQGAQAVARVLADQGVSVVVARSANELHRTDPGPDATVLVTSAQLLGTTTAERLLRDAGDSRLVVAEPGPGVTQALGFPAGVAVPGAESGSDCSEPLYADLTIDVDHGVEYPTAAGCFAGDRGYLVAFPAPDVTLLGGAGILRNDTVTGADNAALALRLLGQRERLVWYVPSLSDLSAGEGVSLSTLLPRWVRPALWVVTFTALGLLLWRGRRLGSLVTEPLPVTVRSIETTLSRGRLYRKAGDRAHAARSLRARARRTAAAHLGLPLLRADESHLVDEVARRVRRPRAEIESLLGSTGPVPGSDHDLLALASSLAELEREVRRT